MRERLEVVQEGLPAGVTLETYYDRTELVDRTIRTVATNLVEGATLVVVILLLLLGNVRGGLLVASVIPLSMLATLIAMNGMGVSGNLMSLGALDFGLIIDGAVVVVENVVRRLRETGARGQEVAGVVRAATKQVARPVVFGTAIIMIVYIPVLSLQGIEGKMFRPMALTVLAALLAALVLALTLVPALATIAYRKGVRGEEPRLVRLAQRIYEPALAWAVRRWWAMALVALVSVVLAGALAARMGAEFIPRLDEGAIAMQAIRPPSVALEESVVAASAIEATLQEHFPDEVETVVSRTGRAEIATDPMGVEISDIYIMLRPQEQWTKAQSKVALVERMEERLRAEVPGQNFSFSQPIELRTNELISGARSDVAVRLYGPELDRLEDVGDRIAEVLRRVPGAQDVAADQVAGLPTLRVKADREALARYGLDVADVLAAVSAMGGHQVGTVFEGQQRHPLQVRLPPGARQSVDDIESLLIGGDTGQRVPLGQVAQVQFEEGPARRQPRERPATPHDRSQRPGPGSGRLRRRGSPASAPGGGDAAGLLCGVGRPIRESGGRLGQAGAGGAGGLGLDLSAPLHDVRRAAPCRDHLPQRSHGRGGRRWWSCGCGTCPSPSRPLWASSRCPASPCSMVW